MQIDQIEMKLTRAELKLINAALCVYARHQRDNAEHNPKLPKLAASYRRYVTRANALSNRVFDHIETIDEIRSIRSI